MIELQRTSYLNGIHLNDGMRCESSEAEIILWLLVVNHFFIYCLLIKWLCLLSFILLLVLQLIDLLHILHLLIVVLTKYLVESKHQREKVE